MGLDTTFSEIIGIARVWHYKRGLYSSYALMAIILFFAFDGVEIEEMKLFVFLYIILCFLIWIIWKFTTNRWIIRNGYDLILGIILEIEAHPENNDILVVYKNIKKYSQSIVKGMNVKIIYYPANAISHENMKTFIKNQRSQVDGFLRFSAICGNMNNDYKIQIQKIRLYSSVPTNYKLFDRNIDLRNQIAIQGFANEMKIVKSTSFDDKKNLNDHLESFINHYIGIWFVIKNENEKALEFLERNISKVDITNHNIQKRVNNRENSIFSDLNLLDLVCRLYLLTSDKYIYNNQDKALKILSKYEDLNIDTIDTNFSNIFYLRLARMHYETGNLGKAIHYTNKIESNNPNDYSLYFNRVFFGILQNDFILITSNLKEIFHKRNKINFEIQIIDFLQKEILKNPEREQLFIIVINFYQALFTDKEIGKSNLRLLVGNIENREGASELVNLVNRII